MTSRPALAASASVSASNMTNAAFPPGPPRRHPGEDLAIAQEVVADVLDRRELAVLAVGGHDDAGMAALERVEERDVEQVAHPAVDPQEVERGGRDEVDRRLVGPEELPDLGDPAQRGGSDRSRRRRVSAGRPCVNLSRSTAAGHAEFGEGTCAEVDEPLDGLGRREHGAVAPARPEHLHATRAARRRRARSARRTPAGRRGWRRRAGRPSPARAARSGGRRSAPGAATRARRPRGPASA